MGPDQTSGNAPAVTRAVRILGLLADAPRQVRTLTEISRELGVAKSSVSNLCVALEEGGLVRRSGGGYLLGRRTVELGGAFLNGFDQIREFYRVCEDSEVLRRQLRADRHARRRRVLYLAVHEGRERFPLSANVGDRYPASSLLRLAPPCSPNSAPPRSRRSIGTLASWSASPNDRRPHSHSCKPNWSAPANADMPPMKAKYTPPCSDSQSWSLDLVPVPSFGLGVSIVQPTGTQQERDTVLEALRAAAQRLTRPRLLTG